MLLVFPFTRFSPTIIAFLLFIDVTENLFTHGLKIV